MQHFDRRRVYIQAFHTHLSVIPSSSSAEEDVRVASRCNISNQKLCQQASKQRALDAKMMRFPIERSWRKIYGGKTKTRMLYNRTTHPQIVSHLCAASSGATRNENMRRATSRTRDWIGTHKKTQPSTWSTKHKHTETPHHICIPHAHTHTKRSLPV